MLIIVLTIIRTAILNMAVRYRNWCSNKRIRNIKKNRTKKIIYQTIRKNKLSITLIISR